MTIYNPDPAAGARKLRQDLSVAAALLREKGAEVELFDHGSNSTHTVVMIFTMRCSTAKAEWIAQKLEVIANRTDGIASNSLHSPIPLNLPDGTHSFGVVYSLTKPTSKFRRAA